GGGNEDRRALRRCLTRPRGLGRDHGLAAVRALADGVSRAISRVALPLLLQSRQRRHRVAARVPSAESRLREIQSTLRRWPEGQHYPNSASQRVFQRPRKAGSAFSATARNMASRPARGIARVLQLAQHLENVVVAGHLPDGIDPAEDELALL